ncbi:MAG: hypothetical protein J7498_07160 [Sphingobium sp.]|nr:hypothetical protein [Sphingobium sp.]
MKTVAAWLVATSLLSAQAQASDRPTCLSDAEFSDVILLMAPEALKSMSEQCKGSLTRGQVLGNPDSLAIKNFAAASADAWPRVLPALARFASKKDGKLSETEATLFRSIFLTVTQQQTKGLIKKPEDCQAADRILKLAEPLPPQNLAGIIIEVARMGKQKDSDLLCKRD